VADVKSSGAGEGGRPERADPPSLGYQGQRTFGFHGWKVPMGLFFQTQACKA
jgi:hypothetical protein